MDFKYKMGWGNPYFLLEILDRIYSQSAFPFNVKNMIYGPYNGNESLIKATEEVILQTTYNKYNHILITNGASGALNLLFRKIKNDFVTTVNTTQYGYPSYEKMISRAGLRRVRYLTTLPNDNTINLIDSPENPAGHQVDLGFADRDIWDSVYHNKIYTNNTHIQPKHKYLVGSYSKLLGIAGARVGFIATNDSLAYESLLQQLHNEHTGVSKPSQDLIVDILNKIDLDNFMLYGKTDLDNNRSEFQKIEYIFDNQQVNENGMFYCAKADDKALELLKKASVEYVTLDSETIRLSMGQTKTVVQDCIKEILKKDNKK